MDLNYFFRQWELDPSDRQSLINFMLLARRSNQELEFSDFIEIKRLLKDQKDKIKLYIDVMVDANFGDPSWTAYLLVNHYQNRWGLKVTNPDDVAWAISVIEKSNHKNIGDPSFAAYSMAQSRFADLGWAMQIIKTTRVGHPTHSAFKLAEYFSDPTLEDWVIKITEEFTFENDRANTAADLVRSGIASPEWGRAIIENAEGEASAEAACAMVRGGFATNYWGRRIVEERKSAYAAYDMALRKFGSWTWAKKVVESCPIVSDRIEIAERIVQNNNASRKWLARIYRL